MKRIQGLTFIEWLCCVCLLGVLLGFSVPALTVWLNKNKINAMEHAIIDGVHYARNLALMEGKRLALTPLTGKKDWSFGMILFVDNQTHQYQEGSEMIHQWQWNVSELRVRWHGFQSDHYLLFSSDLKHAATTGHFVIQVRGEKPVKLVLNRLGRVSKLVL